MFLLGSSYFVFVFLSLWCLWWEVWDNCIDSWSLPSFLLSFINRSNLSRRPFSHTQDPNIVLVIHLAVIAKQLLPTPNLLVKTRIKIPYLNQRAISAKTGHIISECLHLKRKKKKEEGLKPTSLTSVRPKPHSYVKEDDPTQTERSETDSIMEIYERFLSNGFASLNNDYAQSTPIKILRNTGASQSPIFNRYSAFFWENFFWDKYSGCSVWIC